MILVTGAAGYIGSAIVLFFSQMGYDVIALDHATDFPQIIQQTAKKIFIADFADQKVLDEIFTNFNIKTVIHCAAFIEVGESVIDPAKYYENNVIKTKKLLDAMVAHKVPHIIFSSSCALYGTPQQLPLTEDHPKNPVSPYGNTKLIIELMLQDYKQAYGLNYVALRYFNAAGAWPEYNLFERHQPESHLIPRLLHAAQTQQEFNIYGHDYETNDGTCIRDYLHIKDLADAHWRAMVYLDQQKSSRAFNLGTGKGYSVKHVIQTVESIMQQKIKVKITHRRAGDPAILIADATVAQKELNWHPQFSELENIISDALHGFDYSQTNVKSPCIFLAIRNDESLQ